jgi:hypothetical protein
MMGNRALGFAPRCVIVCQTPWLSATSRDWSRPSPTHTLRAEARGLAKLETSQLAVAVSVVAFSLHIRSTGTDSVVCTITKGVLTRPTPTPTIQPPPLLWGLVVSWAAVGRGFQGAFHRAHDLPHVA